MIDLKELIEQELDQCLEWPTADKSHVTTVSAKLFAEHVATLYADHIPDNSACSARAIFKELGYAKWENFNTLIRRACQMIAHGVAHGSIKETTTPVTLGSGAIRHVIDYELDSQARDLVCLLAASFKLNGHHIARNETAILGLVKKWCEQRGLPARHQKNVCGFSVDMQVGDSLSIEFDEPHHAYQQLADRRRTMVIEKSGSKVIRFGLDCDVIDIITEIERLIPASKKIGRPQIREVFLRNGAVADSDDMPDYVYESVFELLELAAPDVQGEPVAFDEDVALTLAEREFYTEIDEQLASDIIRYARKLRTLYTAPQPTEQQPAPDVEALVGLLEHARCNTCDGSGALYDGHGQVRQCRWCHDRSAALAAHQQGGGE